MMRPGWERGQSSGLPTKESTMQVPILPGQTSYGQRCFLKERLEAYMTLSKSNRSDGGGEGGSDPFFPPYSLVVMPEGGTTPKLSCLEGLCCWVVLSAEGVFGKAEAVERHKAGKADPSLRSGWQGWRLRTAMGRVRVAITHTLE